LEVVKIDNPNEYTIKLPEGNVEVTCDEYTSGKIYVTAWDDESLTSEHWVSIPGSISEPGPYKIFIRNVEPGNHVWIYGLWDRDGSGPLPTTGDCLGHPENPIYLEEEITGIDFDLDTEY